MAGKHKNESRTGELLSHLIDGSLSPEDQKELITLVRKDVRHLEQLVDHVVLDTLLNEEIGAESLAELVDYFQDTSGEGVGKENVAADSVKADASEVKNSEPNRVTSYRPTRTRFQFQGKRQWFVWLAMAATIAFVVIFAGRWYGPAYAGASAVVQTAIDTHKQPIERIYVVDVKFHDTSMAPAIAQDARIATQGNRFWVEMKYNRKRWTWGQTPDGAIWLVLGSRRAILLDREEVGEPLKQIAEIYSLRVESLLHELLRDFDLEQTRVDEMTHVIVARSRGGSPRWLRRATLEIDTETKAIRRLILERRFASGQLSTITFTLVETRVADEDLFQPQGHLREPFEVFSRDSSPGRRQGILQHWFGSMAARWLKTKETNR